MLQHYSPYKVAENFNILAALGPGRVDLGIGRAPGGLPRSTQALQEGIQEAASLKEKIVQVKRSSTMSKLKISRIHLQVSALRLCRIFQRSCTYLEQVSIVQVWLRNWDSHMSFHCSLTVI